MAAKDESALATRQREALGHYREGLSNREVAERMGVGTSAAAEHKRRLVEKGFLPKSRRNRRRGGGGQQRQQEPTGVRGSARGSTAQVGGNGKLLLKEAVPSLPKALEEIDHKIEANTEEMRALNQRQSALAEESNGLARLREDIDKALV